MIMEIAGAEEWAAHVVSIWTPVCYKYCVTLYRNNKDVQ